MLKFKRILIKRVLFDAKNYYSFALVLKYNLNFSSNLKDKVVSVRKKVIGLKYA